MHAGRKDCEKGRICDRFSLLASIVMAPRALVSKIDSLVICASPKASCRSVSDFAWNVAQVKTVRRTLKSNVIVVRNPYRRLISAYLNKYVEHKKYREASLKVCPAACLDSFEEFVDELYVNRYRCVDKVHFKPQMSRYRWRSFDMIFNAEDLRPLAAFVNGLYGTSVAMPFRVAANRPKEARGQSAEGAEAKLEDGADVPLWQYGVDRLRSLLAEGVSPDYASFFNDELRAKSSRIYRADLQFLDSALKRGLIDAVNHAQLVMI